MQRVIAFGSALVLLSACGDGDGRDSDSLGQVTSASGISTQPGTGSETGGSETGDGSETDDGGTDGSSGDGSTDPTGTPTTDSGEPTTDTPTTDPTTGDPTTGDPTDDPTEEPTDSDTGEECAAISEGADLQPLPADIIFALDTSGSMDLEINSVKNNMNAFSSTIINSGVDAHVIVIADPGEICIAAPLGSGMCPADSNEPVYVHVNEGVGSHNALEKVLATHDQWKDFMRPNGKKHVVVVSDDDSNMGANAFHSAFQALGPEYVDYRFHGIVSEVDPGDVFGDCIPNPDCCLIYTAEKGEQYLNLIALTGGLFGDLCDQDFGPIFTELSTEVVDSAPLPCEFEIPEPMGEDIDFGKVNVQFDHDGIEEVFPKVQGPDECMNVPDGWYYDDEQNPTKIVLCDATCSKVQNEDDGEINVQFGCDTIIPE